MEKRIAFASSLRGIAALCVLVAHHTGVYWFNRPGIEALFASPTLPTDAAPNLFRALHTALLPLNAGAFGVALFFLVSGFVIPFSLLSYSRLGFLAGRVLRIYPTYAAGFAVTAAAIVISAGLNGLPVPYAPQAFAVHAVPGLREILASPAIDLVVWTLEAEIKFYLLSALAAAWLRSGSLYVFAIPAAMLLLPRVAPSSFAFLGGDSFVVVPFMFIGVALNFLYRGKISLPAAGAVCAGLLIGCSETPVLAPLMPSYGAAVAAFAGAMLLPNAALDRASLRFLAAISYPLYICHAVAGYAVMAAIERSGAPAAAVLVAGSGSAILMAWALHRTVELPSQRAGRRVARALTPQAPAAAPAIATPTDPRPELPHRRPDAA